LDPNTPFFAAAKVTSIEPVIPVNFGRLIPATTMLTKLGFRRIRDKHIPMGSYRKMYRYGLGGLWLFEPNDSKLALPSLAFGLRIILPDPKALAQEVVGWVRSGGTEASFEEGEDEEDVIVRIEFFPSPVLLTRGRA
jgi:hypothetical protein